MSDPFESDLSRLAPDIDLDRAHRAFESTRSRRRNRRRTAGGLGGAALAAALVAGVLATGGDGTESVTADGPIGFGPSLTSTVGDVNDEPLTSTAGGVADEALRQSPCEPRSGGFDCVRPSDIEPALGRVVERFTTGVGDEFGYVIEFAPDSDWTWRDVSGGEHSDAELIEDPTQASIIPTAGVELYQSCEARPEVGARVEAVPAGPLTRGPDGSVSGAAWLTLSCVDLELARQLWADSGITLYTQRFEGWLDGRGIGPQVDVSDGVVTRGAGFDTEALFERIDGAMTAGDTVHALFDPTLGFVDRLVIEGDGEIELDITSRDFRAATRASACPGPVGGPLDLTAEPVEWALSGELTRWFDPAGCPIRLDVIQQSWGPGHCSMERAQFMTLPPAADVEVTDERRTYVFDPDRTLSHRSEEQWGRLASPDQRPPGLADTGLQSAEGHEMWIDPEDADHLWLIRDDELQVWRLDPDGYTFECF